MLKQTPLYDEHVAAGGKMVDFSGWSMPIHYGSQIEEHHKVRQDVGLFDVSHMTVVDIEGNDARPFLRYLLANDVARLKTEGKALYTCMLNENAGVIDDLIVYFMRTDWYRLVVNAATREKDLAWIKQHSSDFDVTINERPELAMLAVQGPNAADRLCDVLKDSQCDQVRELSPFNAAIVDDYFIARTGYTGEDGFEILLSGDMAVDLWRRLVEKGVSPIGLGARDTLRLEAGMNLYGSDMDETTTPLQSGLGWTVAWDPEDRNFIGREVLAQQKAEKPDTKLVGIVLEEKGVLRNHQKVIVAGVGDGEITSGSFSPTLGFSIAFARVPWATEADCSVEIRGKLAPVRIVRAPFVRNGKSCLA